ncbi:MAG: type IV toxin-antitoxin system AbiEi family antitoxin domain-containing protein [Coriobacteriales bacterium]|jgi:predicted transcriptional regulator of viral defense system|nr:type IV toxin-antitoxin system AbiEi family antitoxin domain-containing protein [Coriobacteriales bacterium]
MRKKSETLDILLDKNLGYLKTADAIKAGISKVYLSNYVCKHNLERVSHGLYMSQDAWTDDLYVIQTRYPRAIFSHETALYLLGLGEREPTQYSVTLKTSMSATNLSKQGIKVYKIKEELFDLGLIKTKSPVGHLLRSYNAERTICDLVRSRSTVEIQDLQSALKEYFRKKEKNIPQLMRYAKLLSVENIIRHYTEVLL